MASYWGTDSSAFFPPSSESVTNHMPVTSKQFTPLRKGEGFAIVGYKSITPGISSLLIICRPSAIGRLVVSIYVDPVECHTLGPIPHIKQEIFKRIPAFAHTDSSPTVVMERLVSYRIAPCKHGGPRSVSSGVPFSVNRIGNFCRVFCITPTRLRVAASKVARSNDAFVSAVTNAVPQGVTKLVFSALRNNSQAMEFLTSNVDYFCHFVTSKLLTVKGALQSAVRQSFGSYPSQAGAFYHV